VALAAAVHAHAVKFWLVRNDNVASASCTRPGGDGAASRAVLEDGTAAASSVAWNALISGHNRAKRFGQSRCAFADMVRAGVAPTPVTYVSVLSACGKSKDALLGTQVAQARPRQRSAAGPQGGERAARHGRGVEVIRRYGNKERGVVDDTGLWVREVRGQVDRAREPFDRMPERDTVSWTAMIGGYVQAARFREALEMFHEMQYSNLRADEFTTVSVITSCA
jgi:pentatricopeptide repeat protein